jgi:hypothetical protein
MVTAKFAPLKAAVIALARRDFGKRSDATG